MNSLRNLLGMKNDTVSAFIPPDSTPANLSTTHSTKERPSNKESESKNGYCFEDELEYATDVTQCIELITIEIEHRNLVLVSEIEQLIQQVKKKEEQLKLTPKTPKNEIKKLHLLIKKIEEQRDMHVFKIEKIKLLISKHKLIDRIAKFIGSKTTRDIQSVEHVPSSVYTTETIPNITIKKFLDLAVAGLFVTLNLRYGMIKYIPEDVLLHMVVLLNRYLLANKNDYLNEYNVHSLVFVCIVLAVKSADAEDRILNNFNLKITKYTGTECDVLGDLERSFLEYIDWDCRITLDTLTRTKLEINHPSNQFMPNFFLRQPSSQDDKNSDSYLVPPESKYPPLRSLTEI